MCCSPAHLTELHCGATVPAQVQLWLSCHRELGISCVVTQPGGLGTHTSGQDLTFRWGALAGITQGGHASTWPVTEGFRSLGMLKSWLESRKYLLVCPSEAGCPSWGAPHCHPAAHALRDCTPQYLVTMLTWSYRAVEWGKDTCRREATQQQSRQWAFECPTSQRHL